MSASRFHVLTLPLVNSKTSNFSEVKRAYGLRQRCPIALVRLSLHESNLLIYEHKAEEEGLYIPCSKLLQMGVPEGECGFGQLVMSQKRVKR